MIKNICKLILILLISILCFGNDFKVENGFVDLTKYNFSSNKNIKLDGEWDFYWKELLQPKDFDTISVDRKSNILIPGSWNNKYCNIDSISDRGYATYRLQIKIKNGQYYIRVPAIFTATKIWINGTEIIEIGKIAKTKESIIPAYVSYSIPLEIHNEIIDIIINVSNFHHSKPGIRTSIILDNLSAMHRDSVLKSSEELLILLLTLIIGFFHIIVYLFVYKEKNISNLLFGLFSIGFAIRLLMLNEEILYLIIPNMNWFIAIKIEWLIASSTSWIGLLFIVKKYPAETKGNIWKVFLGLGLLLSSILMFLDVYTMSKFLTITLTYTVILVTYIAFIVLRAYLNKKEDSFVLILGFVVIILSIIIDFILLEIYEYNFNIVTYGFITFLVTYSYNLIINLISISKELDKYQDNLEKMIYDRTSQLEDSKIQLEQKIHETVVSQSKLRKSNNELLNQITENEETKIALLKSEKRFRELADLLPEVLYETDGKLKFTYINQAATNKFGYSKDEIINKMSAKDFLLEKDFKLLLKNSYNPKVDPIISYNEYTFIKKDGSTFTGLINGIPVYEKEKPVGFRGIVIDLSKIKETEREILKLQEYLTNIINSMPSTMIGINKNFEITLWNNEAEKTFQISEKDAINNNLFKICGNLINNHKMIKMSMETNKIKVAKLQIANANEIGYENITVYPLKNDQDGAVIRIDNISEQVKMEELIIQSEKMMSIGGLAAGMAHEINNPLAGMIQNSYVISNRFKPTNIKRFITNDDNANIILNFIKERKLNKLLSLIIDSGHRAAKIVDNMLSFAKQGTISFNQENINFIIDETLELAFSDYDMKKKFDFKKIHIEKQYTDNLPSILCEKSKLQQVFLNILKNAAEATHDKLMKMNINTIEYEPIIQVNTKENEKSIIVEFIDNGPGISEHVKGRIFEPFFTTKDVNSGTGLGLSVSYFIITKNHHGTMHVESIEGKETKFVITLPKQAVN